MTSRLLGPPSDTVSRVPSRPCAAAALIYGAATAAAVEAAAVLRRSRRFIACPVRAFVALAATTAIAMPSDGADPSLNSAGMHHPNWRFYGRWWHRMRPARMALGV